MLHKKILADPFLSLCQLVAEAKQLDQLTQQHAGKGREIAAHLAQIRRNVRQEYSEQKHGASMTFPKYVRQRHVFLSSVLSYVQELMINKNDAIKVASFRFYIKDLDAPQKVKNILSEILETLPKS